MKGHDPQADGLLREAGLKVTDQRRKILTFLLAHHGPFTVEEMAQELGPQAFDLATLYRNMISFEGEGLVQKIHFGDGSVRWELGTKAHAHGHHHHHVICTSCKQIRPLDICVSEATLEQVRALGYTELQHHLEFSGLCHSCQKKAR